MTIAYRLGNSLYLNITNRCSCSCIFCIRNLTSSVGDADSLWLEREPSVEEIKTALATALQEKDADEVVFCGYGEPMERADVVVEICQYLKTSFFSLYKKPAPKVRINTNGLAFLMNKDFDISSLSLVDTVSISLNADDNEEYQRLSKPRYGDDAYSSLLEFARQAKVYTNVVFSILEKTLSDERVENCRRIADNMGIPLRIRGME